MSSLLLPVPLSFILICFFGFYIYWKRVVIPSVLRLFDFPGHQASARLIPLVMLPLQTLLYRCEYSWEGASALSRKDNIVEIKVCYPDTDLIWFHA